MLMECCKLCVYLCVLGRGHSGEINKVKIAPDGCHAVSVSADGAIIRWRIPPPVSMIKEEEEDKKIEEDMERVNISKEEEEKEAEVEQDENNKSLPEEREEDTMETKEAERSAHDSDTN